MKKPKVKCLNPACKGAAFARGLCKPEYQAAFRLVRTGRTTWADLIARGKCLEKTQNKTGSRKAWLVDTEGVP